jgi:hypothetical protein
MHNRYSIMHNLCMCVYVYIFVGLGFPVYTLEEKHVFSTALCD